MRRCSVDPMAEWPLLCDFLLCQKRCVTMGFGHETDLCSAFAESQSWPDLPASCLMSLYAGPCCLSP